jgi:hypothetical protein
MALGARVDTKIRIGRIGKTGLIHEASRRASNGAAVPPLSGKPDAVALLDAAPVERLGRGVVAAAGSEQEDRDQESDGFHANILARLFDPFEL